MQKRFAIILFSLAFHAASAANSSSAPAAIAKADSLYTARQYTQAFTLYQAVFEGGRYTPAMLLRMAYIQEGLDHLGESLYYLNLYFLATNDTQALKKMEELAKKNNLEGYETSESARILAWLQDQYFTIAWTLASLSILLLALTGYQRVKKHGTPSLTGVALVLVLALLFVHINFSLRYERGIIARPMTYLMSGPSSGSSVIAIVGEGHSLAIRGREDVWMKVEWKNEEVYVRGDRIKEVKL